MKKFFTSCILNALFVMLSFPIVRVYPLEIPLPSPGTSSSEEGGGEARQFRIAYADMELIYNVCPQRTRASNEYKAAKEKFELSVSSISAALDKRKKELEELDKEIAELRLVASSPQGEIGASSSTATPSTSSSSADLFAVPGATVVPSASVGEKSSVVASTSSASVVSVEKLYEKEIARKSLVGEIDKLSVALKSARETMDAELSRMEKECAAGVLEELYKVLQKIASEEDLILIIDKNYILYAPEPYDITPKVIERLK